MSMKPHELLRMLANEIERGIPVSAIASSYNLSDNQEISLRRLVRSCQRSKGVLIPDEDRDIIFELHYIHHMSMAHLAEKFEVSENAIHSAMVRWGFSPKEVINKMEMPSMTIARLSSRYLSENVDKPFILLVNSSPRFVVTPLQMTDKFKEVFL